jgi:hypothetical protein
MKSAVQFASFHTSTNLRGNTNSFLFFSGCEVERGEEEFSHFHLNLLKSLEKLRMQLKGPSSHIRLTVPLN